MWHDWARSPLRPGLVISGLGHNLAISQRADLTPHQLRNGALRRVLHFMGREVQGR